ncbi:hypothetical protein Drorol1_Dr00013429, partial [Drosera rotundifolia]
TENSEEELELRDIAHEAEDAGTPAALNNTGNTSRLGRAIRCFATPEEAVPCFATLGRMIPCFATPGRMIPCFAKSRSASFPPWAKVGRSSS